MDSTGVIPLPAAISTWCPGVSRSGVNEPEGGCASIDVAGPHLAHQPAGDRAARHLPHADARRASPRRADGVGPALAATADGQRLPGREGEPFGQRGRHVERHRGRVVGERIDPRHRERVELRPRPGHQMSLTYSKGSRQVSQRNSALHAVAPNAAVCVVSGRAAAGAFDRLAPGHGQGERDRSLARGHGVRRGDAGRAQFPAPLGGDPVAAPGGGEGGAHRDLGEAGLAELAPQVVRDLAQRRAARVGGGDRHHQAFALGGHVTQDAQVGHRHHGQLGVGHGRGDGPRGVQA